MASNITLSLHHTQGELLDLYKKAKEPTLRTRLHFLSIVRNTDPRDSTLRVSLQTGMQRVGMKLTWAQDTVRRYNTEGIEGLVDKRVNNKRPRLISEEEERVLREKIVHELSPDGWLWTWPKVATYLGEITGQETNAVTGWRYLQYLGFSRQVPRLAHEKRATKEEQDDFKKNFKSSSRNSENSIKTRK